MKVDIIIGSQNLEALEAWIDLGHNFVKFKFDGAELQLVF